jgi:hypothetical protein
MSSNGPVSPMLTPTVTVTDNGSRGSSLPFMPRRLTTQRGQATREHYGEWCSSSRAGVPEDPSGTKNHAARRRPSRTRPRARSRPGPRGQRRPRRRRARPPQPGLRRAHPDRGAPNRPVVSGLVQGHDSRFLRPRVARDRGLWSQAGSGLRPIRARTSGRRNGGMFFGG